MEVGLLFSGGKDSTLAARVLSSVADVTLLTGTFGITDDWRHARAAADALDYPFERIALDPDVAETAVERMHDDGYPRRGIQRVHEHALEAVADAGFATVADGTRRDDRVPTVDRATAQSLEDRRDVDYVAPLSGWGRGAVDSAVGDAFDVHRGESGRIDRADYEAELRVLLAERYGPDRAGEVFPDHTQSRVDGRR